MSREQKFYEALKRIAREYQTPDQLRRNCEKQYGLGYEECLAMVYENLQYEAARAIKGYRKPRPEPPTADRDAIREG